MEQTKAKMMKKWWPKWWKNEDSSRHSQKLQPRALAKEPHQKSSFFLHFSSFLWFLLRILGISEIPRKWWSKRRPKWWKNDDQNDEKMKIPRGIPKNSGRGLWPKEPHQKSSFFLHFFIVFLWFLLRILGISEIPRKWWSKRRPKWWKNDDQNDEKMKIPRGIPKNSSRGLWPKNPTRNLHFFFIFSSFLWFLLRILRISEIPRKWWSKRRPKWWKNDDQNDEKMKIPRGIPKNSGRGLWPKNPTRNLHFFFIFSSFLWFLLRILRISEIPRKWWSKRGQNDEKIPRGIPKNSGRGLWPKNPTRNLHFFFIFSSFLWFCFESYESLRFLGNDGANEGQNDEKMMTKMMKKWRFLEAFPKTPAEGSGQGTPPEIFIFSSFFHRFCWFCLEFLGIPYTSLSFPGNDGPNEGQNDEKMMTKMMKKWRINSF